MRQLPWNKQAEENILGAMLARRDAVDHAVSELKEDSFFDARHALVYKVICDVYNAGRPVDAFVVFDELQKNGGMGKSIELPTLLDWLEKTFEPSFREYCKLVQKDYILRTLIKTTGEIQAACYGKESDPAEIVGKAEEVLLNTVIESAAEFRPAAPILHELINDLEAQAATPGKIRGILTGYHKLDNALNGLRPGRLILLAARPSQGKTAFALNIARHVALQGLPVGFVSLEMGDTELVLRLLSIDAKIDSIKAERGQLSRDEWAEAMSAASRLAAMPIFFDSQSGQTIGQIKAKVRRLVAQKKIKLLIVDYLGLINMSSKYNNRNIELGEVSSRLKGMAKEFKIPVIALSQLSRDIEKSGKFRWPQNSDLRDSGALEQDADIVMFITRPETAGYESVVVAGQDFGTKDKAFISITKHRHGRAGLVIPFQFIAERTEFAELEDEVQQPEYF